METLLYCENFKALAVQKTEIDHTREIIRLRCKQWTCPYCASKNREIWRAKLIHHISVRKGDWCWFTLTAHGKKRGAEKSLANLRGAWDTVMKRMKRKYGDFEYARIYEKHADGSYHIHAIASFNFDDLRYRISRKDKTRTSISSWLQKTAWELGIGMYTHADNIVQNELHSGYVASYITKYIVKLDTSTKSELGRIRHIQTSQNWIVRKYEKLGQFAFKQGIYYDDIIQALGYEYIDVQNKHAVTLDDFDLTYIYPPDFDHRHNQKVDKP